MAPEIHENEKLDFPVDVYSFGITVWEVYTLEVPFNNISEFAFFRKVIDQQERPKCPPTMNRDLVDLVSRCWAHNAEERPIFKDISLSIWTDVHGNHSLPLTSLESEAKQREGDGRRLQAVVEDMEMEKQTQANDERITNLRQEEEEKVQEQTADDKEAQEQAEQNSRIFTCVRGAGGYVRKSDGRFSTFDDMARQFGVYDLAEETEGTVSMVMRFTGSLTFYN